MKEKQHPRFPMLFTRLGRRTMLRSLGTFGAGGTALIVARPFSAQAASLESSTPTALNAGPPALHQQVQPASREQSIANTRSPQQSGAKNGGSAPGI